jgi:hypothetical protein
MAVEEGWLREVIGIARMDLPTGLARVSASPLSPREKQGVSLALKGISSYEQASGRDSSGLSLEQLGRLGEGVLMDEVDASYIGTWLAYSGLLRGVKDEGGIKRVDRKPDQEVGPPTLGVQRSLTSYGVADEGAGDENAGEV